MYSENSERENLVVQRWQKSSFRDHYLLILSVVLCSGVKQLKVTNVKGYH